MNGTLETLVGTAHAVTPIGFAIALSVVVLSLLFCVPDPLSLAAAEADSPLLLRGGCR